MSKAEDAGLSHLCRIELPTVINWASSFPFEGLLGGSFHFHSTFDRLFCKQAVESLIRRCVLWRLALVFTVCPCPTKGRLAYMG